MKKSVWLALGALTMLLTAVGWGSPKEAEAFSEYPTLGMDQDMAVFHARQYSAVREAEAPVNFDAARNTALAAYDVARLERRAAASSARYSALATRSLGVRAATLALEPDLAVFHARQYRSLRPASSIVVGAYYGEDMAVFHARLYRTWRAAAFAAANPE